MLSAGFDILLRTGWFTNVDGQHINLTAGGAYGNIAVFSSRGPASDQRTKPDITAPGLSVASAVSRFDPDYMPGGAGSSGVVYE